MAANALVRARIDETLKDQAADVLAEMGLTISDLIRITLTKVAREKALPFDLRIPNELTSRTIENSEAGEAGVDIHKAKDADDLFDQLGI
ncbi:type II toxin-antitoxin system RelB/DinJ family antitoxin [Salmonella enterica]|nr:type II toxin-antitoxin system RelB/DinJ family antitoxin [Salmonella enterica]